MPADTTTSHAGDADAVALRDDMVLRVTDYLRTISRLDLTDRVADTMRQVERHRFVPAVSLEDAYAEQAVITHPSPDGRPLALSCASTPSVVAAMLNALDVRPGHRVLEIGAGTGYNAALLATLAGPDGQVTTVDINPDVTAAARDHLDDNGFPNVRVLTRDGALGAPEHAPYDRIIVTVGASDIPLTWWEQLTEDGRLVLPLRWRATTRAIALTKTGDHWTSDWDFLCGFVPMIGQPMEAETALDANGWIKLHHDTDQQIDHNQLTGVMDRAKAEHWTDETVHGEEALDGIWLRLTSTDPRTIRLEADRRAIEAGLCKPAVAIRSPALVDGDSLAYLSIRRVDDESGRWQLGAIGHGPAGPELAAVIGDAIRAWSPNRTAGIRVRAYPRALAQQPADAMTIEKPETIMTMEV